MIEQLKALATDERGPTAIEYALIALMVAMAIIAALIFIGTSLGNFFGYMGNQVDR